MATVTIATRADGVVNSATASFTSDGSAQIITLGFTPTNVLVFNETDVIRWEKFDPMVAANCIKTVGAGTMTLDAGSQILINTDKTITLGATLVGTAKAIKVRAMLS